ncbi:hNH endonuclease [Escherichia coli]|nr:hNH endonuclease [Escherichia coli]
MKQMTLIEMDGFLKGKCIPRDLKVNETNAEYLVRKFAEAEAKISALSEDQQRAIESIKQADAAVKLAHEKFSAMAAENARLKSAVTQQIELRAEIKKADRPPHADFWVQSICEAEEKVKRALEETPATDAFLAEVRAKAFDDLCAAFVKHASVSGLDDGDCVTVKEATDALLHCAEQLHKGVHS